jgi:hypothetical protein
MNDSKSIAWWKAEPMKKVGDTMLFTGGAEKTPQVTVSTFLCPGSLNNGKRNLKITQDGVTIELSPETMEAILEWYYR